MEKAETASVFEVITPVDKSTWFYSDKVIAEVQTGVCGGACTFTCICIGVIFTGARYVCRAYVQYSCATLYEWIIYSKLYVKSVIYSRF